MVNMFGDTKIKMRKCLVGQSSVRALRAFLIYYVLCASKLKTRKSEYNYCKLTREYSRVVFVFQRFYRAEFYAYFELYHMYWIM